MNRSEILAKADKYVSNDRNTQYGEPEDAFRVIAEFWSTYLRIKVDAYDVACLLSLMKVARMSRRPKNLDSCIDLAGYAACAGEILDRTNGSIMAASPPPSPPPMPSAVAVRPGMPPSHG